MIPVNRPGIPKKTKKYFDECADTGWFSAEGPFVKQFEKEFAEYLGVKYAVSTNSGTCSLHLALLSLGIGEGDEVLLPASTIASCFFAILYTGAKAVPVDVDEEIFAINPDLLEKKLTKHTKAIMPVHLYGHPCDMDPIQQFAEKHGLFTVEDAAEAHGADYKGKKVGGLGNIGCFSFYGNKIVTTGEGGMVVTNDKTLYEKAKSLANLNHTKEKRFVHEGIGYRYAMSNMQAALGVASLEEIGKSLSYKKKMAQYYLEALKDVPGIILPKEKSWATNVHWMFAVRIDAKKFGCDRNELMKILLEQYDIQTRSFFYSPNVAFANLHLFDNQHFPVAEKIEEDGLYLPSGLGNTMSEFKTVVDAIKRIHKTFL